MEIASGNSGLLQCRMGKKQKSPPPRLYVPQWIDALGFERKAVAEEAEIGVSYIANMGRVAAQKNPSSQVLKKIANSIGCTVEDFYRPPPPRATLESLAGYSPEALAGLLQQSSKK